MTLRIASIVALPACAFLAACEGGVGATEDACGASGYQTLVGSPLAAVTLPADLAARIIQPGTPVTTDFNPERMNIEVDADGSIVHVFCG